METPEVINEGKPQGLTKKDCLKNPEKARYRERERERERGRERETLLLPVIYHLISWVKVKCRSMYMYMLLAKLRQVCLFYNVSIYHQLFVCKNFILD